MPNDDFGDKDQLSDAFDGVDSLAHLTAVGDPRSDRASFYACSTTPNSTSPAVGTSNCVAIGTDSTGTQPVGPSGSNETFDAGSYKAYETFWDIPSGLDRQDVNIVTRVCAGEPSTTTANGIPTNCRDSVQSNITLDDSSSAGQNTPVQFGSGQDLPTGEIVGICRDSANNCLPTTTTNGTGTGTYSDLPHGSTVPSGDFSIKFRTSRDVTTGVGACLGRVTGQSSSTGEASPTKCEETATTTEVTTSSQTTYREWVARFGTNAVTQPAAGTQPNSGSSFINLDLAIYGVPSGATTPANECDNTTAGFTTATNDCVLDEHYVTSAVASNAGITATFRNSNASPTPAGSTTCANPDKAESNRLGTSEVVTACLTDASGSPRASQTVTFESSGVGTLACTGGTQANPTPASDVQRCTATTDANGQATATLTNAAGESTANNRAGSPGTQTVNVCAGDEASTSASFGCADEELTDTVVKEWVTVPSDVTMVFAAADGTADCAAGDQFKVNTVGDDDTLVACVFDAQGRPASTAGADSDGTGANQNNYRLNFSTGNCNSVGFTSNPPSETGSDGQATVNIRAIDRGTCTVTVKLQTSTGTGAYTDTDTAQVTKSVEQGAQPQPECNDGIDNDGDGLIDYPDDPGCTSIDDNTEDSDQPGPEPVKTFHDRTIKITKFRHVDIGKKRPALLVKGRVTAPGYPDCAQAVPVKVQIRAGGEWITRKSDSTNDRGVFKVLIRHVHKKYRAVANRYQIEDTDRNTVDVCRRVRNAKRYRH